MDAVQVRIGIYRVCLELHKEGKYFIDFALDSSCSMIFFSSFFAACWLRMEFSVSGRIAYLRKILCRVWIGLLFHGIFFVGFGRAASWHQVEFSGSGRVADWSKFFVGYGWNFELIQKEFIDSVRVVCRRNLFCRAGVELEFDGILYYGYRLSLNRIFRFRLHVVFKWKYQVRVSLSFNGFFFLTNQVRVATRWNISLSNSN